MSGRAHIAGRAARTIPMKTTWNLIRTLDFVRIISSLMVIFSVLKQGAVINVLQSYDTAARAQFYSIRVNRDKLARMFSYPATASDNDKPA